MISPTSKKLIAAVVVASAALIASMASSSRAFDEQIKSRGWVVHTYEVLNALELMVSDLKDVESAQRGYIIAGDEHYLQPYTEAVLRVDDQLKKLKELVQDNPAQLIQLEALQAKIHERLTSGQQGIELRRTKSFDAAREFVAANQATEQADGAKRIVTEMTARERSLLEQRLDDLQETTVQTLQYTNLLRFLIFGVVLIGSWSLNYYLSKREKAEQLLAMQYSMSKLSNDSLSLTEAAREFERIICEKGDWSLAATWLLDEQQNALRCLDVWHLPKFADSKFLIDTKTRIFSEGEGLPGTVWATNKSASLADLERSKTFSRAALTKEIGLASAFAFPITSENKFIGVIEFFSDQRRMLDPQTASTFESIGREIGGLVGRQKSQQQITEMAWLSEYVAQIARCLNSGTSLQTMLEECATETLNHLGVSSTGIWLFQEDGKSLSLVAKAGLFAPFDCQQDGTADDGIICSLAREKRSLLSNDLENDLGVHEREWAKKEGMVAFAGYPLITGDSALGVIALAARNPLSDTVIDALAAVANYIVVGVQRKLNFDSLRQSQLRFRAVFDSTFGFIGVVSPDGTLLDANQTALDFVGVEYSEVVGKAFWETPWWSHSAELQDELKAAIAKAASGELVRFETRHPSKTGQMFDFDFSLKPIFDAAGDVVLLIPEGRDITEKNLFESRFRVLADFSTEIFWVSDSSGKMPLYVSPAYETVYQRSVESLFQDPKSFFEAIVPEDRELMAQHIRCLRTVDKKATDFQFRIARPDGEVRWLWARLRSVLDKEGKMVQLCGVTSDITQQKEVETRVSEFYSTVSHELRTPLTSIRGSLGLIEGGLTGVIPEKTLKMIKIARSESDRLIRLINDILDLQKIEAGMIELRKADVDAVKLVERTLDGLKGMALTADISLASKLQAAGTVLCDRDRIIQVLTNLVSNAIKFSPAGSEVILSLEPGQINHFKFSVADNGPGIPPDQAHKLFARFQQLDQSDSRKKGGTGLGLAITKAIVEEHGGKIGVESKVGEGSTFWFELPATPLAESAKTSTSTESDGRDQSATSIEGESNENGSASPERDGSEIGSTSADDTPISPLSESENTSTLTKSSDKKSASLSGESDYTSASRNVEDESTSTPP